MRILIEIIAALLFVMSSGLFFNGRFRHNIIAVTVAGTVATVSSYLLIDSFHLRFLDGSADLVSKASAAPAPAPAMASVSAEPRAKEAAETVALIIASHFFAGQE